MDLSTAVELPTTCTKLSYSQRKSSISALSIINNNNSNHKNAINNVILDLSAEFSYSQLNALKKGELIHIIMNDHSKNLCKECNSCNERIEQVDNSVKCKMCVNIMHIKCCYLTDNILDALTAENSNLAILCNSCKNANYEALDRKICTLEEKINK